MLVLHDRPAEGPAPPKATWVDFARTGEPREGRCRKEVAQGVEKKSGRRFSPRTAGHDGSRSRLLPSLTARGSLRSRSCAAGTTRPMQPSRRSRGKNFPRTRSFSRVFPPAYGEESFWRVVFREEIAPNLEDQVVRRCAVARQSCSRSST